MHTACTGHGHEESKADGARDSPVVVEALGVDMAVASCETCCGLSLVADGIRPRRVAAVAIEKDECIVSVGTTKATDKALRRHVTRLGSLERGSESRSLSLSI